MHQLGRFATDPEIARQQTMTLTFFSDYSLRVLMFAALRQPGQFSVNEVAGAYGLSRHHVAKVVNFLVHHGYLSARRGRGGGIRLGKAPGEIRIGEVARQTEAGSPLVECFDPPANSCPLIGACRLKRALGQAWNAFFNVLDGYTLADLVQNRNDLNRLLEVRL
jgi:Rrf2 family transcriptional regulator, nitric oxide-sensitive transcriptional repressor